MKTFLSVAVAVLVLAAANLGHAQNVSPTNLPVVMVIVGDSTVCNWPTNDARRGWGMFIQDYFQPNLKVINLAKSGRSTKTFIQEHLWAAALKAHPNYVLIQFGHNDSHAPSKPEATDANTNYKEYLRQYIDDTRAIGARPVLVTPMCRRTFAADGTLTDALLPYANAMKEVAAEKKVPLVDLHTASAKLFEKLGAAESEKLANSASDSTHFNARGAKAMAALVMQELPVVEPSLAAYLKLAERSN